MNEPDQFAMGFRWAVDKANEQIIRKSLNGVHPVSVGVMREFEVYKRSKNAYLTVVLEAYSRNGLTGVKQFQTYLIPIERMMLGLVSL